MTPTDAIRFAAEAAAKQRQLYSQAFELLKQAPSVAKIEDAVTALEDALGGEDWSEQWKPVDSVADWTGKPETESKLVDRLAAVGGRQRARLAKLVAARQEALAEVAAIVSQLGKLAADAEKRLDAADGDGDVSHHEVFQEAEEGAFALLDADAVLEDLDSGERPPKTFSPEQAESAALAALDELVLAE